MTTDLQIRRLIPADHAIWHDIRRASLLKDPDQFDEPLSDFDATSIHDLKAYLQRNTVFAALTSGTPIAIAASYAVPAPRNGRFVRIFGVWVQPDHRGKGLAERLIQRCIPEHTHAELLVRANNSPAVNAYERMGFVETPAPTDAKCYCATDDAPGIYMLRPPAP